MIRVEKNAEELRRKDVTMTNYDAIEQLTKLKGVCEQMGWSNNVKALEMAISTLKTPQLRTSPLLPRGAYNRKRGTDERF